MGDRLQQPGGFFAGGGWVGGRVWGGGGFIFSTSQFHHTLSLCLSLLCEQPCFFKFGFHVSSSGAFMCLTP